MIAQKIVCKERNGDFLVPAKEAGEERALSKIHGGIADQTLP
jgi:hypothetical protein